MTSPLVWADLFEPSPRPGVTIASRHTPFGNAVRRNGEVLHRLRRVVIRWEGGRPAQFGAVWQCQRTIGSTHVRLVADPTGHRWCERCDIEGVQTDPQVLYVGVMPDGRVKVGTTRHLAIRRRQLGIRLLGFCPGGYSEEIGLVAAMGEPIEGREWFAPGSEATALAWMSQRTEAAS